MQFFERLIFLGFSKLSFFLGLSLILHCIFYKYMLTRDCFMIRNELTEKESITYFLYLMVTIRVMMIKNWLFFNKRIAG